MSYKKGSLCHKVKAAFNSLQEFFCEAEDFGGNFFSFFFQHSAINRVCKAEYCNAYKSQNYSGKEVYAGPYHAATHAYAE